MDIENTLVSRIELKNKTELVNIKANPDYKKEYVVVKAKDKKSKGCCEHENTSDCVCDVFVYKIRPYTFEFLRAIQPFFEILIFSKMHPNILLNVCNHLE